MAKLRDDLAQAKQDADNLRTSEIVNASLAKASTEDGSKSIAEQVAENVEAVRAELDLRHQERVKEADETLEKRTNNMKVQLSKKLTEGKAQIRQNLVTEHEETVRKLKFEHHQELETLAKRHKDELDELRRNGDSRFARLQEAWEKDHQSLSNNDGASDAKAGTENPQSLWKPSESETRAFLQSNEVARNIIRKNIITQVTKAKDELTAQLKEEHEKAMTESQNKASTAKEHAVMMEGKKTALQINMANNKARISQFKIGLVEKAAQDTPQKPVEEVWSVVKDAKPPPVTVSQPQQGLAKTQQSPAGAASGQPTTSGQPAQQRAATAAFGQANPFTQNATNSQKNPASSIFGQLTPFSQTTTTAQQQSTQTNQAAQQPNTLTFGRPSPTTILVQAPLPKEQGSSAPQQLTQSQASPSTTHDDQHSPSKQELPSSQQKPSQSTANHHSNAGTGPGALRGLQHSGLPVARGGSIRGNANARGRGSGVGRGGPQGINTNQGQQQGRNSPTRGGMNPGAKQFVPGNKRPRDEEQQGGDASVGKRIRGGGGGG